MTAEQVIAAIEAAGGRVVLDNPADPHLKVPARLRPLADAHREQLRAYLRERALLAAAGVRDDDAQAATEAARLFDGHIERAWPLSDPTLCQRCGRDSCEGDCRSLVIGCSRCGNCDSTKLYARLEAGPLCSDCWRAAGQPWR